MEAFIRKLDSPTYLGDPTATVQSIVETTQNMSQNLEDLVKARSLTKEEFLDQLKGTLRTNGRLFDVVKGVSRNVDDAQARQQLLDAARSTANAIGNLISTLSDEVEKAGEQLQNSKQQLSELATAAENTTKSTVDVSGLESLAEKELSAAAQQVRVKNKTFFFLFN